MHDEWPQHEADLPVPAARGALEWEDIPAAIDQLGRYVRRFGVPDPEPLADRLDAEAVALAELERVRPA
jgi:hypothetical protein